MKISVIGLNYKTAPVDVREKLAFNPAQAQDALGVLKTKFGETEFVLISTCNRVELYSAGRAEQDFNIDRAAEFLSEFHGVAQEDFRQFLYSHEAEDAARHLFMVASSLDSMVVGETEIISQIKEGFRLACAAGSTGKILNRLFHYSFLTGKKVHTTTDISSGRVSVAGVAVELAMQLFAEMSSAKVVVIGAGQMGELLVQHLVQIDSKDITVVNRSYDRAVNMAERYNAVACKWDQLSEQLIEANIVIASASVQDYLFSKDSFRKMMKKRRKRALLLIDIAVPRNFDPAINEIGDVYLYSIDELSEVADQNRKLREDDVAGGMRIVYENAAHFMDWFKARDIGPLIGQMRKQFAKITENELDRFFVGSRQDASCKDTATMMVKKIVNKLLHCVIQNVDVVVKKHGPTEAARLVDHIVKQAEEISSAPVNEEDSSS